MTEALAGYPEEWWVVAPEDLHIEEWGWGYNYTEECAWRRYHGRRILVALLYSRLHMRRSYRTFHCTG